VSSSQSLVFTFIVLVLVYDSIILNMRFFVFSVFYLYPPVLSSLFAISFFVGS
jgi:hypothetical protein